MATRHQRRKAAKARWIAKATALVEAHRAWERDQIVKSNLRNPHRPERSGPLASSAGNWQLAYAARGAMGKATRNLPNDQVKRKR